ncbi:hypothetical protein fugu_017123 [Takifugu bimaculatus]|uniref:Ig-like domain-containing protein n=1 Tax=Takifugu bimaculatus TaxID=433685 RepID=A0A4Z2BUX5_9TELE|nr:hypothetical protein fugu_017117 [Takifugu bimaculatus]TNM96040.1 hypothetical protein fugu_017123 [Takifugu bimaculatus]
MFDANGSGATLELCATYEAYFGSGTKLTVLETGLNVTRPTVTLLPPSSRECRNQKDQIRKKTIVCVASGFYPDHVSVSWEVNGQKVTDGVATDGAALRAEGRFYRISSRLRVSAEDWFRPDSDFTCIISFFNGTSTELYSASLQGEAAAATEVMSRETYLRITQAAKLSYGVFILKSVVYGAFVIFLAWKLQGWTGKQNL